MYLDKLDGRIGAAFFDRKAGEWRREQDAILRNIQIHQDTDQNHIEDVWDSEITSGGNWCPGTLVKLPSEPRASSNRGAWPSDWLAPSCGRSKSAADTATTLVPSAVAAWRE
jgi:hypothetical protein